jgi:ribosomal protein L44E
MPPTLSMQCPTCKTQTPHATSPVRRDERGKYQEMACASAGCGTLTKVYTGEDGEDFQSNLDAPNGTESKGE